MHAFSGRRHKTLLAALALLCSIVLLFQCDCRSEPVRDDPHDILFYLRSYRGHPGPETSHEREQWWLENRVYVLFRGGELLRPTGKDASSFESRQLDERKLSEVMELLVRMRQAKQRGDGDMVIVDSRHHWLTVFDDGGDRWEYAESPDASRPTPLSRLVELLHSSELMPPPL